MKIYNETITGKEEQFFSDEHKALVEFYDYSIHKQGDIFLAAGRERGYILKNGKKMELDIRTSRIYGKENGNYKQLHHHGSITDVKLLDTYQKLVMEK